MSTPATPPGVLDPDLPGLDAVLSQGDGRRIRHVEWSPRQRCQVVQEIRSGAVPTFVVHDVTPAQSTTRCMCPDPMLPGLPDTLDVAQVGARLAAVDGGVLAGPPVPVVYRPESRAVITYDVAGPGGRARLFAKLLAAGSARSAATCTAIAEAARRRGGPVRPSRRSWRFGRTSARWYLRRRLGGGCPGARRGRRPQRGCASCGGWGSCSRACTPRRRPLGSRLDGRRRARAAGDPARPGMARRPRGRARARRGA